MIFVFRLLQIILLLFMLAITGLVVVSWFKISSFKWAPFLAMLGLFGGMLAMLEALVRSRKKRETQKKKYTESYVQTIDHLEFWLRKSSGIISFILLFIIVLPLMYLGALEDSPLIQKIADILKLGEDQWFALWGFEIACLALLLHTIRHLYVLHVVNSDKPYLAVDESGIFSPLTGKLPWQDILNLNLIKRRIQYSSYAFLRITFKTPDGSRKSKDIALNAIRELKPDVIFAVAKRLFEKHTNNGETLMSAEWRQEFDEVDMQIQRAAKLMEEAEPGSVEYFQAMKRVEQGMLKMINLNDELIRQPQKQVWDRILKAFLEKEVRLNQKLEDARRKWITYLSRLETRAAEEQAIDMETFDKNMEKANIFIDKINDQLKKIRESKSQRIKRLLRYKQIAVYSFGILLFIGMIYLKIKAG